MADFHAAVTDDRFGSYDEERKQLDEVNADLSIHNLGNEAEAVEVLRNADAVFVNLFPLTESIIGSLKKCRIISRYGIGYDNVDVEAATRAGIWVSRVPDYAYEDVSDHALALLLACVRNITDKDRRIREGGWNLHRDYQTARISGKILGFVGYGGIGRALHRKVSGLGLAKILVFDPFLDDREIEAAGAVPSGFDELLRESDFITVHAPLSDETRGMIGGEQFQQMKQTAIIVNTSRGPLIDEGALIQSLQDSRIGCAGLDVFEEEPLAQDSPLMKLNNVVLSDHAGWYTVESVVELKTKAARNVVQVLGGGKPVYPVNQI